MTVKAQGVALFGIDGLIIQSEVSFQQGMPGIDVVGLPETSVKEAKFRVQSAFRAAAYEWPQERLIVNFAPANLPKGGTALDLPMAIAIMALMEMLPVESLEDVVFYGELGLDGSIRPVPGAINAALAARKAGFKEIYLAPENALEASFVPGISCFSSESLGALVDHLTGLIPLQPLTGDATFSRPCPEVDMEVIRGQRVAKRALEVAAAGRHNVIFIGPPGCGKTLLARALPGILPPLNLEEALEVTRIHSIANLSHDLRGLVRLPPFRTPHPTSSQVALVGGGSPPVPGEISLAHRGVLFLDEAAEFKRASLDALRAPIEDRSISISRSRRRVSFPSAVMLVLSTNPCPCGHYGNPKVRCKCTPAMVRAYQQRLSGPLLDRIDIQVELSPVEHRELEMLAAQESSEKIQERVILARKRQEERQGPALSNADLKLQQLETVAALGPSESRYLSKAAEVLGISARAWHRILRVARTIADLEGAKEVQTQHLGEALSYRRALGAAKSEKLSAII